MRYSPGDFAWISDGPEDREVVRRLNRQAYARIDNNGNAVPSCYMPTNEINRGPGIRYVYNEVPFIYAGQDEDGYHLFTPDNGEHELPLPPAPDLDLSAMPDTERRLPPFKIVYDSLEESKLRLQGTVIMLRGRPFVVSMVGGTNKKVNLLLEDSTGQRHKILLNDVPDLRSCSPRYISHDGHSYYLTRTPARVFQQGMTQNNTYAKLTGSGSLTSLGKGNLLKALADKKPLPWNETLDKLIRDGHFRDLRLSGSVSVYRNKAKVVTEFRGRDFGKVLDDTIIPFFPDDASCPWIQTAFREVNLKVQNVSA